jgi:hypothetical protein
MNSKEIKKIILAVLFCFFTLNSAYPQVAINTNGAQPNSSSILDVSSTTKGLLIPCMTEAQRNAITVTSTEKGLLVFQTDGTMGFYFYSGSSWVAIFNSLTSGVGGTGTSNYIPYWTASNNIGNSGLYWSGTNLGIGTTTPNNKLQIGSTTYSVNSLAMGNGTQNFAIDISARTIPTFFSDNNFSFMGSGGSGNVGIGTATPTAQLDVLSSNTYGISSTGSTTGSTGLYHIANSNAPTSWNLGVEGGAWAGGSLGSLYIDKEGVGPKMTIAPDGNVGIGTTNPIRGIHNGTTEMIVAENQSGLADWKKWRVYLGGGAGAKQSLVFGIINDAGTASLWNPIEMNPNTFTTTFNNNLSMSGGAYCNGTTWTNASDIRLKRDIQPMSKYGLSTVMQLKPVTYFYKADKTNHPEVGFIAQDMQKIIPEVVSGTEGDISKGETLGLSYGNLVPVLTKAIQEQQSEITSLKSEMEQMKSDIQQLKSGNALSNAGFGGNTLLVLLSVIGIALGVVLYRKVSK